MIELIVSKLTDPRFIATAVAGIAATATVFMVASPFAQRDELKRRMKAVAAERERIRARERERLNKGVPKASLRQAPKAYMKQIVDRFKLDDWLGTDTAKQKLSMAGYRGQQAEIGFLFFRLIMPVLFLLVSAFYLFVLGLID